MNVVFISPHFPPQFFQFCTALRERGVNVLGLGDAPAETLRPELRAALGEHYFSPRLEHYEEAHRALSYLSWRHGRIHRIDSHNEHWLELEARLREDFNIPGPRPEQLAPQRSKLGMASLFQQAGVPHIEGELFSTSEQARAFAQKHGFPLVLKPDVGVGAARTFKVSSEDELERALKEPLSGYLLQPFIAGVITSYDGLVNRDGRIVFVTSHLYSAGVMEIVNEARDLFYWSRRDIPDELDRLGRRVVEAFDIRERFFHVEFFEQPDGSYRALEVNLRPPGGFTTDMMNYGSDFDVYRLWARIIAGDSAEDFEFERKYHVAYVARRWGRAYRYSKHELAARLGKTLLLERDVPRAFAGAMGDDMFLLRHPELDALKEAIALVQKG